MPIYADVPFPSLGFDVKSNPGLAVDTCLIMQRRRPWSTRASEAHAMSRLEKAVARIPVRRLKTRLRCSHITHNPKL